MAEKQIKLLDQKQIDQKINRMAFQIYEDHSEEKAVIIVGIADRGYTLAKLISKKLEEISDLNITLAEVKVDKEKPFTSEVTFGMKEAEYKNKSIILVDDVLNSGKTLIYAVRYFLTVPLKKLSTLVMVDRKHRRFPIRADYVGHSLATTMQEHISVDLNKGKSGVYLS